jgi:hypothetical protein
VADYIGDADNVLGVSSKLLQAVNGCPMDSAEVHLTQSNNITGKMLSPYRIQTVQKNAFSGFGS